MKTIRRPRRVGVLVALAITFSMLGSLSGITPRSSLATRLQDAGTPVQGGSIQTAISEDITQLDPARFGSLNDALIMNGTIYDSLVYIGEGGRPEPWIAESWTVSDDATVITFTIRSGIKFHDGTDLDASAVKIGYDRILDPANAAIAKAFLGTLEKVDAPDATTVVFTFTEPYAPFFTGVSTIGIASPTAIETLGEDFGHNPVGSGPFKFKEWVPSSKLVLERNPDYVNYRADDTNKGPAYVDEIVYNVISEATTQTAAFEAGELNIIDAPREDVARLAAEPNVKIVSLEQSNNVNFIEFANTPPYNNEYFRKAVAYAIDRDSIVEIAYSGNATPNQCPVPIGNAAYDANLCAEHGYTYDLEKAKQVLAEGGFTDTDGNGFVELDGKDLEVTLWSYAPYPVQAKTIEIIQPDLNKIGLKAEVQTIEFAAMQPMLQNGEIGFDYMRWTYQDQSIISAMFKSPGWANQTNDPELDKLIKVADTTVDPDKRLEASHAAVAYILDHAIIAPVNSDWIQVAIRDNVQNYHWDASNSYRLNDVWISTE